MSKRDFVMLAKKYNPDKHQVYQWFMSEKLDGMRAIWDGGVSRGVKIEDVPYANKTMLHRFVTLPICTGLWSRYGNPIMAPDWWLDALPKGRMLDGELYIGHGKFQETVEVTKSYASENWHKITYRVYDSPPPETLLGSGVVRASGGGAFTIPPVAWDWAKGKGLKSFFNPGAKFAERLTSLEIPSLAKGHLFLHPQTLLDGTVEIAPFMEEILLKGGEGVILKSNGPYLCKRTDGMLKYKPYSDDEATVSGYTSGRETDRGSKLLGLMGSLEVLWKGKVFELSGFTEAERVLRTVGDHDVAKATAWARDNPETKLPDWIEATEFARGSRVTFMYRELSKDGIPKEARYHRKRDEE